jgi:hypothetical protein
VIPHLNDVIRLEPSHLGEADDSAEGDDGTATDHPKTSSTGGSHSSGWQTSLQ